MEITDIRIRRINRVGKVKAISSITIDDCFVVHDIKIIDGAQGLFVAMPSRQASDGEYRDIAHPINSETRVYVKDTILAAYEELLAKEDEFSSEEVAAEEASF